jgi:hypothetical protein
MGLGYWARLSGVYLQKLGWGYRVWCFSFWMGLSLVFLLLFSSLGTYILFLLAGLAGLVGTLGSTVFGDGISLHSYIHVLAYLLCFHS